MKLAIEDRTPTSRLAWLCRLIDTYADADAGDRIGMPFFGLLCIVVADDNGHIDPEDLRDAFNLLGPVFGIQLDPNLFTPPDEEP